MSRKPVRIVLFSVVPSPYQRELFAALARRPEVELSVFYQERQPHDSPWPPLPLAEYEAVLPGFYLRMGTVRTHINWSLPEPEHFDIWVVNAALTSLTAQWLMRVGLSGRRWFFWGERIRSGRVGWRRWGQDLLAGALRGAEGIFSIGELAREDYSVRFPLLRQAVIPYCTEMDAFVRAGEARVAGGDLTFLFCGQMIERKGIDLLLRAFSRLVMDGAAVRLLLVGREAQLPSLLAMLPESVRGRIVYEGFQPPERLPEFFARADVFVLPSRHDGWGVVVNQAMAAGLPVLASDEVGAARDFVEPGRNGWLVAAGVEEELYGAMVDALRRREELPLWGRESLRRAQELTPEVGARKLVQAMNLLEE